MYTLDIEPRFNDCDGLRHINNTVIPVWFEQARNQIYRIFNPAFDFETWNLILARYEIDFVRPLSITRDVHIRTVIAHIGNSSFTVEQEALQDGVLCTRGKTVLVHYDFAANRSKQIPEEIRAKLSEHLREHPRS